MYIRTVKYIDFNDNEVEEELCFHIGKGELLDMEKEEGTSISKVLIDLGKNMDGAKIINMCKTIIEKSYGVKSSDGKHFRKNPEILQDFIYSAAYDQLLVELLEDPSDALNFLASILPLSNEQKESIKGPIDEARVAVEEAKARIAEESANKTEATTTPILVDNEVQ